MEKKENKELLPITAITLASNIKAIIDVIIENGGEITEEQDKQLSELKTDLAEKARNYSFIKADIEGRINYFKKVKELADSKIKALENAQTNLNKRLIAAMKLANMTKISSNDGLFSVSICKGKEKLVEGDVRALDLDYVTIEEVIHPIKDKIKAALKEGKTVGEAHIEYGEDYLRFNIKKVKEAE